MFAKSIKDLRSRMRLALIWHPDGLSELRSSESRDNVLKISENVFMLFNLQGNLLGGWTTGQSIASRPFLIRRPGGLLQQPV